MQIQISERRLFWWLIIGVAIVLTWNIVTATIG
jgi:hypothetical protein